MPSRACAGLLMNFPDLSPWFDSVSDEYQELPCGDNEAPYDE